MNPETLLLVLAVMFAAFTLAAIVLDITVPGGFQWPFSWPKSKQDEIDDVISERFPSDD